MSEEQNQPVVIPDDIKAMSNDQLIAEHRQIGDHCAEQLKKLNEFLKPLREREDFIERMLFIRLSELNAGKTEGKRASISTDSGTAYLSTIVTPKIKPDERENYLAWILEDWDARGAMLSIGAPVKDAFNSYVDEHKAPPPHVEISSFTRVNIRRS